MIVEFIENNSPARTEVLKTCVAGSRDAFVREKSMLEHGFRCAPKLYQATETTLTIECIDGDSIADLMESEKSVKVWRKILISIARGLREIHGVGQFVGDVSLADIIWDGERAYFVDFDWQPGNFTPGILPPETADSGDWLPHSDIYALGMIIRNLNQCGIGIYEGLSIKCLSSDTALRPNARDVVRSLKLPIFLANLTIRGASIIFATLATLFIVGHDRRAAIVLPGLKGGDLWEARRALPALSQQNQSSAAKLIADHDLGDVFFSVANVRAVYAWDVPVIQIDSLGADHYLGIGSSVQVADGCSGYILSIGYESVVVAMKNGGTRSFPLNVPKRVGFYVDDLIYADHPHVVVYPYGDNLANVVMAAELAMGKPVRNPSAYEIQGMVAGKFSAKTAELFIRSISEDVGIGKAGDYFQWINHNFRVAVPITSGPVSKNLIEERLDLSMDIEDVESPNYRSFLDGDVVGYRSSVSELADFLGMHSAFECYNQGAVKFTFRKEK